MADYSKIAVLGAGAWGTALAAAFSRGGHDVRLWGRDEAVIGEIRIAHSNTTYIPGANLPETLVATTDLRTALSCADIVLFVTPAQSTRALAMLVKGDLPAGVPLIACAGSSIICCSRSPWTGPQYPMEKWIVFDPLTDAWSFAHPIDIVINAIGIIQESKAMTFEKAHVWITEAILRQRAALGQPRIVQVSALGANMAHETDFLRTKGEADALLLREANVCVLRPSIVCTPDTMLSQKLRQLLKIARFSLGKMLVPTGFAATQIQPIMGADVGFAVALAALQPQSAHLIELVGPQRISFGELIAEMAAAQGRSVRLLEVSREIMETFVKHFVGVWFPELINYQQFRLLFVDNVGDAQATTNLLGRAPLDTMPFWREEAQPISEEEQFKEIAKLAIADK